MVSRLEVWVFVYHANHVLVNSCLAIENLKPSQSLTILALSCEVLAYLIAYSLLVEFLQLLIFSLCFWNSCRHLHTVFWNNPAFTQVTIRTFRFCPYLKRFPQCGKIYSTRLTIPIHAFLFLVFMLMAIKLIVRRSIFAWEAFFVNPTTWYITHALTTCIIFCGFNVSNEAQLKCKTFFVLFILTSFNQ